MCGRWCDSTKCVHLTQGTDGWNWRAKCSNPFGGLYWIKFKVQWFGISTKNLDWILGTNEVQLSKCRSLAGDFVCIVDLFHSSMSYWSICWKILNVQFETILKRLLEHSAPFPQAFVHLLSIQHQLHTTPMVSHLECFCLWMYILDDLQFAAQNYWNLDVGFVIRCKFYF